MNKFKKALTLAEILICLVVIGVISAIIIPMINSQNFGEKADLLTAQKIVGTVNDVANDMRGTETDLIPMGKFLSNSTFVFYKNATTLADAAFVADMFGGYMKMDGGVIDFCTYSKFCNDNTVKGFRVPGNAFVGFKVGVENCPSVYNLDDLAAGKKAIPTDFNGATRKCWGRLYIQGNAKACTGTKTNCAGVGGEGKDFFIFGLDEYGVAQG